MYSGKIENNQRIVTVDKRRLNLYHDIFLESNVFSWGDNNKDSLQLSVAILSSTGLKKEIVIDIYARFCEEVIQKLKKNKEWDMSSEQIANWLKSIIKKDKKMNKAQFTELVQSNGEYNTKAEAEKAINAFTESITQALASGENISLVGFGSFSAALQKGKSGTIPGTDKTYTTQDKMVPKFKAGKSLKERVASDK